MKYLTKIFLAVPVLLLVTCSTETSSFQPKYQMEFGSGDTYKIYRSILNTHFGSYTPTLVLADSTETYDISYDTDYLKSNIPGLLDETITDYQDRNSQPERVLHVPNLIITVYLIPSEDEGSWKTLYPDADALIHFSRVGFNADRTQALVYVSDYYGPLAASGNMVFLERDGEWTVKKVLLVWIS
jgi:hypothetical protein